MCNRYRYREDVTAPDIQNRCLCLHGVYPQKYPTCICNHRGVWVCEVCGDVKHSGAMKGCCVCQYGIVGGVRYSQHYHDGCAPADVQEWIASIGVH